MNVKYFLFISLILILSEINYSQTHQQKIYSFDSTNGLKTEVLDISPVGTFIIEQSNHDSSYYYLCGIDSSKMFLWSSSYNIKADITRFSENYRYIVFKIKNNDKTSIKIFDVINNKIKDIKNEKGNIVTASILNFDDIAYELRLREDEFPQIFYLNKDKETFFANGYGGKLSPDGKWIIIRDAIAKVPVKKGYEIKTGFYSIFNKEGFKILSLSDFNNIVEILWAPASDKLLIRNLGDPGFNIVYLENDSSGLQIKEQKHFENITKHNNYFNSVVDVKWSPDGEYVLYKKSLEDGHRVYENSLWIYSEKDSSCKQVYNTSNKINNYCFTLSGDIILSEENQDILKHTDIIKIS